MGLITECVLKQYGYSILDAYLLENPFNCKLKKNVKISDLKMRYTYELEGLYNKITQEKIIRNQETKNPSKTSRGVK